MHPNTESGISQNIPSLKMTGCCRRFDLVSLCEEVFAVNTPIRHMSMKKKIIQEIHSGSANPLVRYKNIQVGDASWIYFLYFEVVTLLFRNLPGILGMLMRSVFFRPLLGSAGKKIIWGTGITLRNPRSIQIGDQVVLDDNCVLDAKGSTDPSGITIGSKSFISRGALVSLKGGRISIGSESSIGPYCLVQSMGESHVRIGDCVAIAPYCYVVGAPDYRTESTDTPMVHQGFAEELPVTIGNDVWIGTSVTVLRGSEVGEGSILGANCVVRGTIPPYSVATGNSIASVRKSRKASVEAPES